MLTTRLALIQKLRDLNSTDLGLLIVAIPGAAMHAPDSLPGPARVAKLIEWADSGTGRGWEEIEETYRVLFPAANPPQPDVLPEKVVSNVPAIIPHFTGRVEDLQRLHNAFQTSHVVALTGMGGIGKTEMAIRFAHEAEVPPLNRFYVTADNRDNLLSGYEQVYKLLHPDAPQENDKQVIASRVKTWLEANKNYLLILDNVENIADLKDFLPEKQAGRILLTTQPQTNAAIGYKVDIEQMDETDGATFLYRRMLKLADDQTLEQVGFPDEKEARALCNDLACWPLAIEQAAAFILNESSTIADYRILYEKARQELLAITSTGSLRQHPGVSETFLIAFRKVEKENTAAVDLLYACAVLAPEPIPDIIFTKGASVLGENLAHIADNHLVWTRIRGAACRYAILRPGKDTTTLSLHRVIRDLLLDRMDVEIRRLWSNRAVCALDTKLVDPEYSEWILYERLLPHLLIIAEKIQNEPFESGEAAHLLNQTAWYLTDRAQYAQAEPLFEKALAIREKVLGSEHPDTAMSLNNLGLLYRKTGRTALAEPLHQRALAIREKALGPEHPDTALSLNNLGGLYMEIGRTVPAESLYQRALTIREKALGPEHSKTAASLNNLGALYRETGRYALAEPLLERALTIYEKALGPEHPDTAKSLDNLGRLYSDTGRYALAEPLHQRALAIREKKLGSEHPDTAKSLNNLASLYADMGRHSDAGLLLKRVLATYRRLLGVKHPTTKRVCHEYAVCLRKQGRLRDAREAEQRC